MCLLWKGCQKMEWSPTEELLAPPTTVCLSVQVVIKLPSLRSPVFLPAGSSLRYECEEWLLHVAKGSHCLKESFSLPVTNRESVHTICICRMACCTPSTFFMCTSSHSSGAQTFNGPSEAVLWMLHLILIWKSHLNEKKWFKDWLEIKYLWTWTPSS